MAQQSHPFGEAIPRKEDDRFLTGRGNYVADQIPERTLWAKFVRSPRAHAKIVRIDVKKAAAAATDFTMFW